MRLSQGQLNLLQTCPRKFQHIYLDQLGSPTAPEQQEHLTWGSQFHLLMQQRELGLPLTPTEWQDEPLYQCMQSFVATAPNIFQPDSALFRQSEHRRSLEFQGYLLTAVYDLLILNPEDAQILDWKTYPKPLKQERLAQDWQTRLYPFLLTETSSYPPEQISMTYWFVRTSDLPNDSSQPQSLHFNYSLEQHEKTREDLQHLLNHLTQWFANYATGEPFPQVEAASRMCKRCTFMVRCQRGTEQSPHQSQTLPDLADIEEIAV